MLHAIIASEAKKRGWENYWLRDFEAVVKPSKTTETINSDVNAFAVAYHLQVKVLTDDLDVLPTNMPTSDSSLGIDANQLAVLDGNAYTVYDCQFLPEYSGKYGVFVSTRHTVFSSAILEYKQGYYTVLRYVVVSKSNPTT